MILRFGPKGYLFFPGVTDQPSYGAAAGRSSEIGSLGLVLRKFPKLGHETWLVGLSRILTC